MNKYDTMLILDSDVGREITYEQLKDQKINSVRLM